MAAEILLVEEEFVSFKQHNYRLFVNVRDISALKNGTSAKTEPLPVGDHKIEVRFGCNASRSYPRTAIKETLTLGLYLHPRSVEGMEVLVTTAVMKNGLGHVISCVPVRLSMVDPYVEIREVMKLEKLYKDYMVRDSLVFEISFGVLSGSRKVLEQAIPLVGTDVSAMYYSDDTKDLKIFVDDEEFMVHRAILIARSSSFRGASLEIGGEGQQTMALEGVEPLIFSTYLYYLYFGVLPSPKHTFNGWKPTFLNLKKLIEFDERYPVKFLKEDCYNTLADRVDTGEEYDVLKFAVEKELTSLKKEMLHRIISGGNVAKFLSTDFCYFMLKYPAFKEEFLTMMRSNLEKVGIK